MGSLYQSEEMCRCQLFLQTESAYTSVAELGEIGLVQFRDLNPDISAFQRKFVNEVRRCEEMERKLRFMEKECSKDKVPLLDTGENPIAPKPREMIDMEANLEKIDNELGEINTNEEMLKKNFLELTELKHILRKTQTFFDEGGRILDARRRVDSSGDTGPLSDEEALLPTGRAAEFRNGHKLQLGMHPISLHVPTASDELAALRQHHEPTDANQDGSSTELQQTAAAAASGGAGPMRLGFVAGVISVEKLAGFERLLWRACRGNVFMRQAPIPEPLEDPHTGEEVHKSVFIVFFQGEQLKSRVKKICEGYRATLYPCPDTPQERREMAIGVMTRLEDLKTVLHQTQDHRHKVLVTVAKNVRAWFTKVRKIKAVYHTLNLFNLDVTQKCLIAECWCPVPDLDLIQRAINRGSEDEGPVSSFLNRMDTDEQPPTYHRTNKFTAGFQNIVDAYGVSSYREVNPSPYLIVTFPFLFAVMFGDLGHGMIMFLAALFFVLRERQLEAKQIQDEIFQMFFGGRYIILLMGAFSMYTGLIYNEVYSRSINIFGSVWLMNAQTIFNSTTIQEEGEKLYTLSPDVSFYNSSYPLGMDPVWTIAENKLAFLNSFKMKMSVIMGVGQMVFGLVLSLQNYRNLKKHLDVWCTFVPQILFLVCIFAYLCLMIIVKWTTFSTAPGYISGYYYPGSHCAPSLLIGLINMFMFKTNGYGFVNGTAENYTELSQCYLNTWYTGQVVIERLLVIIALIAVPWMLLSKPYVLHQRSKRQRHSHLPTVRAEINENGGETEVMHHQNGSAGKSDHSDEPFDLADCLIHSAIHTIEFTLGCVSHTASYLRLWALSLAHAQLSEVLWDMVLGIALRNRSVSGAVLVYFIFWAFAVLTVAVLVLMEGLSAFLHALRLHWFVCCRERTEKDLSTSVNRAVASPAPRRTPFDNPDEMFRTGSRRWSNRSEQATTSCGAEDETSNLQ